MATKKATSKTEAEKTAKSVKTEKTVKVKSEIKAEEPQKIVETQEVEKSSEPQEKEEAKEAVKTPKAKVEKIEKADKAEKPAEKETAKSSKTAKPQTMAELLATSNYQLIVPKKGDSVKGKVIAKQKRTLIIDLGSKTEGVVSGKEYDFAGEFIEDLKVGDEVKAIVVSTENDRGQVILSLKGAASEAKWDYFSKAMEEEEIFEAKGLELNKGGLIVLVNGVRGFVPSSQFGRHFVGKIGQLKGEAFKVRAIEVNSENNRLIFSERHVSEAKELAQREEALDKVKVNEIYEGVVSGVMHFGLFVTVEIPVDEADNKNIGYVEGLVHISEISWEKVNHPKDYHKVGDRLKVKVLGIDEKTGKLNLSIKQLQDDPWLTIAEKYPVGTTFTGKVSRIEQFGVFVNVEPGVDGLIHSSKLTSGQELSVGEEITVNVENVSPEQRRMSLSLVLTEVPMGYK
ncbi:MAG: S1 RNA-binding domain-containing protein [Patescibacteria group bacterium]